MKEDEDAGLYESISDDTMDGSDNGAFITLINNKKRMY